MTTDEKNLLIKSASSTGTLLAEVERMIAAACAAERERISKYCETHGTVGDCDRGFHVMSYRCPQVNLTPIAQAIRSFGPTDALEVERLRAKLEEFDQLKSERPINPIYYDLHHRADLESRLQALAGKEKENAAK